MEIKIKYSKKGFGPYSISFNNQIEAYDWIKYNDIEILEIVMGWEKGLESSTAEMKSKLWKH